MAIQKNYDTTFGVSFPDAYWMVNESRTFKSGQHRSVGCMVSVFKDSNARANGFDPVAVFQYEFDSTVYDALVGSGISAIYDALKADQLQGGIDV